ncbi:MAG: hypothetical protein ACOC92_01855 [bacterium]
MTSRAPTRALVLTAVFLLLAASLFAGGTSRQQQTTAVAFSADGAVESTTGGFLFPDGSLQQSAASGGEGALAASRRLSVNDGLYDNRIPDFSHSRAYIEICFVGGAMEIDENDAGTSTAGGDCAPGDRGWVIERVERPSLHWSAAKAECLKHGMRLPELFEQQVTCREAELIGIVDMTDNWEWVSNTARPLILFEPLTQGNIVPALGGGGDCEHESALWTSHEESTGNVQNFRCAL